ncbi:MAG TPA: cytochrome c oxidase assembly protein [Pirellulales bacterium]|jgi:cytochrome c oxidase assembly factor CtaG|nr:cytochrome c oxidase assembly protein [Pirellulales bacterium]
MNLSLWNALGSWPSAPCLLAGLLAALMIYARGWRLLRRHDRARWSRNKLGAFALALGSLYLALASPIEVFSAFWLSAHMLQHLLLMMVAAPLIWLAAPLLPILQGVPRPIRTVWLAPLLRMNALRAWAFQLSRPSVALALFTAVSWVWHAPALYEGALRWPVLHYLQHGCFLAAALLFWYPVVQPFPAARPQTRWFVLPYLLLADLQNTILSALFTFSARVFYPYYESIPRLGGSSALVDQQLAGILMWIVGSAAFLLPLCLYGWQLLNGPNGARAPRNARSTGEPAPRRAVGRCDQRRRRFDLLALPGVGPVLRSAHTRLLVRLLTGACAAAIVCDGFRGPQVGALNLAGVAPWIHWRWLLVIGLLIGGNWFCYGCPFMVPRALARRLFSARRRWPRWLANKWLAVGLLVSFFWAYEAFSLWDRPLWTAWLVLLYFTAALVIDSSFRGASFCKYVCPIGQFNFVQSLFSPWEVAIREPQVCANCRTHDCLSDARPEPVRGALRGCELELFQPHKQGNLDCTFCLDCARACPHENVGILLAIPGQTLVHDGWRSGIGPLSRRADWGALVMVLSCAAFANAAGMVAPVAAWEERIASQWNLPSLLPMVSLFSLAAMVVAPLAILACATWLSRRGGAPSAFASEPARRTATRYAFAFAPLGCAMWVAHYSFHFFTSYAAIVPAAERFVASLRGPAGVSATWSCRCCQPPGDGLIRLELFILGVGLLGSLYLADCFSRAATDPSDAAPAARRIRLWPWAVALVLLYGCGVWILLQPMQMRGAM